MVELEQEQGNVVEDVVLNVFLFRTACANSASLRCAGPVAPS